MKSNRRAFFTQIESNIDVQPERFFRRQNDFSLLMICSVLSLAVNVLCLSYAFEWGTAPLWIGSGLSLVLLYVTEKKRHGFVYAAIFLGNVSGSLYWQIPLEKSIGYALLNVLEPFLIVHLLNYRDYGSHLKTEFESIQSTIRLLVVSILACTFIGFLGSIISRYGNPDVVFASQWWIWAVSDLTGILGLFPLFCFVRQRKTEPVIPMNPGRFLEVLALFAIGGALIFYLIPFAPEQYQFLHYWFWPFPLSLWLTLRFSRWKVWLILGAGYIITVIATRLGYGPLAHIESPVFRVVEMQLYMLIILIPIILIQSLLSEKMKRLQVIEILFKEAEDARKAAEMANAAKSLFVANVSHELRTPLTAILGFCEIMKKGQSMQNDEFALMRIEKNARDLFYLVEDLLQLTSSESVEHQVRYSTFGIDELISDLKLICDQELKNPSLQCTISSHPAGVSYDIYSDYVRISQVISNLLRNAIKFTQQGRIEVTLQVEQASGDEGRSKDDTLRCLVKDTGIGIEQEYREAIFHPFKQVDPSHTRKYGGTGLGLYISRKIARTLGGDVRLVKSELNVGSTFEAWFPVRRP